jgi:hypothetical protein
VRARNRRPAPPRSAKQWKVFGFDPRDIVAGDEALRKDLRGLGIYFGKAILPTYVLPHFVPAKTLAVWARRSERLAAAVESLAQAAFERPEIYAQMRLRPEARDLLNIDPGYRRIVVLARGDAIPVQGEIVFVEFNCDSPAMMTFADIVAESQLALPMFEPYLHRLRPERRTQRLLEAILDCYREFGGSRSPPTIAIADWEGQKTHWEHLRTAERFEAAGFPTLVCDPRAFRLVRGKLQVRGREVHIVYRRALFGEILERRSEIEPLLKAYRDGRICMVNSLRSYLASSKTTLPLLANGHGPWSAKGVVAESHGLVGDWWRLALHQPRRWVLKKGESHGGHDVLLPDLSTKAEWKVALRHASVEPWIMQRYFAVPRLSLPVCRDGRLHWETKYFNWNPFLFAGRYSGAIARASDTPLINITLGGGLLPTIPYR